MTGFLLQSPHNADMIVFRFYGVLPVMHWTVAFLDAKTFQQ